MIRGNGNLILHYRVLLTDILKDFIAPGLTFSQELSNAYERKEINNPTQSDFPLLIVSCKEKKFFE